MMNRSVEAGPKNAESTPGSPQIRAESGDEWRAGDNLFNNSRPTVRMSVNNKKVATFFCRKTRGHNINGRTVWVNAPLDFLVVLIVF